MHRIGSAFVVGLLLLPGLATGQEPGLVKELAAAPRVVRVEESAALIHTGQALLQQSDASSKLFQHPQSLEADLLKLFAERLAVFPGKEVPCTCVKLNLQFTPQPNDNASVNGVGVQIQEAPVPVGLVVGQLPARQVPFTLDAVLAIPGDKVKGEVVRIPAADKSRIPFATVCPPGARVYVAGQAEKGADLREATRKTLESLRATLKHLELADQHILQIKAFLNPMAQVEEARDEIIRFYGDLVPPVVFVEWKSTLPIEIELIAWDPKQRAAAVEYLTPPGMKASPVYSRVARIGRGPSLYFSGLYGRTADNATAEIEDIFKQLEGLLAKSDSDLRHLVKATYYVSTEDASQKLNELRPRWYDPARPPAASKAMVPAVGRTGRSITIDMIAVPVRR